MIRTTHAVVRTAFCRTRCLSKPLAYTAGYHHEVTRPQPCSSNPLVYTANAPPGYDHSAFVYPNVIDKDEEEVLIQNLQQIFKRRRYEKGHWDAVIVQYKETELFDEVQQLSDSSRNVLHRIRDHLMKQKGSDITWLPCHAIELHPNGELRAHVDSVRYSGGLVAGLSLGTSSIMRLQLPKKDDQSDKEAQVTAEGHVDLLLHPRSLYALTGKSRYDYTHELLPHGSVFGGTGEIVERNQHRWSIIFRDDKQDDSS